jgi:hypothetical protein
MKLINKPIFYLLGLMHGHWDEAEINMGIAMVVPVDKIEEVLKQPKILKKEKEVEEAIHKRHLPTAD